MMYIVELNGKKYSVDVNEAAVHLLGFADDSTLPPATVQDDEHHTFVRAPMYGVISKIEKKPGASVKKGDLLLILEAMKMENEIVSPINGKIAEIRVTPGTTAPKNSVLVVIKH